MGGGPKRTHEMKNRKVGMILLSLAGLALMASAFLVNASPYVTVAQAKTMRGDNLHLAGDLIPGTMRVRSSELKVEFQMKDAEGATVPVIYAGTPPANMGSATKVVAIGQYQEDHFQARQLLLKCPSKYESTDKGAEAGAKKDAPY